MDYREEIINSLVEVCKKARSEGFESAREAYTKQVESSYRKGLEDIWECARKIVLSPIDGGLTVNVFKEIFGESTYQSVLRKYTASEALQKLKEYEEMQNEKCCITCGNHCFNETTEHYFCKVIKEGGICTNYDKWILEKKQKQKCEDCFTKKLTEEKWASAEDCKECKEKQKHDEKSCEECMHGGAEDYDTALCYDCVKGIKDNFEPKQTDAINSNDIKVGDEVMFDGDVALVTKSRFK